MTINGNKHSFFILDNEFIFGDFPVEFNPSNWFISDGIQDSLNHMSIGYLDIQGFHLPPSLTAEEKKTRSEAYIHSIQSKILAQDKQGVSRWIIDLRSNEGGNMWPMLIALAPFFKEGTLGYFKSNTESISWFCRNVQIYHGEENQNLKYTANSDCPTLSNHDKVFLVLICNRTASSGEAIGITLRSLPHVIFIGQRSAGLCTGNEVISFDDNSHLVLTTSQMLDHEEKPFPQGLVPDVFVEDSISILSLSTFLQRPR